MTTTAAFACVFASAARSTGRSTSVPPRSPSPGQRVFSRIARKRERLEDLRSRQLWKIAETLDALARQEVEALRTDTAEDEDHVDHQDIEVLFASIDSS